MQSRARALLEDATHRTQNRNWDLRMFSVDPSRDFLLQPGAIRPFPAEAFSEHYNWLYLVLQALPPGAPSDNTRSGVVRLLVATLADAVALAGLISNVENPLDELGLIPPPHQDPRKALRGTHRAWAALHPPSAVLWDALMQQWGLPNGQARLLATAAAVRKLVSQVARAVLRYVSLGSQCLDRILEVTGFALFENQSGTDYELAARARNDYIEYATAVVKRSDPSRQSKAGEPFLAALTAHAQDAILAAEAVERLTIFAADPIADSQRNEARAVLLREALDELSDADRDAISNVSESEERKAQTRELLKDRIAHISRVARESPAVIGLREAIAAIWANPTTVDRRRYGRLGLLRAYGAKSVADLQRRTNRRGKPRNYLLRWLRFTWAPMVGALGIAGRTTLTAVGLETIDPHRKRLIAWGNREGKLRATVRLARIFYDADEPIERQLHRQQARASLLDLLNQRDLSKSDPAFPIDDTTRLQFLALREMHRQHTTVERLERMLDTPDTLERLGKLSRSKRQRDTVTRIRELFRELRDLSEEKQAIALPPSFTIDGLAVGRRLAEEEERTLIACATAVRPMIDRYSETATRALEELAAWETEALGNVGSDLRDALDVLLAMFAEIRVAPLPLAGKGDGKGKGKKMTKLTPASAYSIAKFLQSAKKDLGMAPTAIMELPAPAKLDLITKIQQICLELAAIQSRLDPTVFDSIEDADAARIIIDGLVREYEQIQRELQASSTTLNNIDLVVSDTDTQKLAEFRLIANLSMTGDTSRRTVIATKFLTDITAKHITIRDAFSAHTIENYYNQLAGSQNNGFTGIAVRTALEGVVGFMARISLVTPYGTWLLNKFASLTPPTDTAAPLYKLIKAAQEALMTKTADGFRGFLSILETFDFAKLSPSNGKGPATALGFLKEWIPSAVSDTLGGGYMTRVFGAMDTFVTGTLDATIGTLELAGSIFGNTWGTALFAAGVFFLAIGGGLYLTQSLLEKIGIGQFTLARFFDTAGTRGRNAFIVLGLLCLMGSFISYGGVAMLLVMFGSSAAVLQNVLTGAIAGTGTGLISTTIQAEMLSRTTWNSYVTQVRNHVVGASVPVKISESETKPVDVRTAIGNYTDDNTDVGRLLRAQYADARDRGLRSFFPRDPYDIVSIPRGEVASTILSLLAEPMAMVLSDSQSALHAAIAIFKPWEWEDIMAANAFGYNNVFTSMGYVAGRLFLTRVARYALTEMYRMRPRKHLNLPIDDPAQNTELSKKLLGLEELKKGTIDAAFMREFTLDKLRQQKIPELAAWGQAIYELARAAQNPSIMDNFYARLPFRATPRIEG